MIKFIRIIIYLVQKKKNLIIKEVHMEKKEQIKNLVDYIIDYKWDVVRIKNIKSRELFTREIKSNKLFT